MSTILASSADTHGLTVDDDTTSVAIAFAAVAAGGFAFLAAAVLTIASIA